MSLVVKKHLAFRVSCHTAEQGGEETSRAKQRRS